MLWIDTEEDVRRLKDLMLSSLLAKRFAFGIEQRPMVTDGCPRLKRSVRQVLVWASMSAEQAELKSCYWCA